uniref:BI1-like protein n=1 Tax=Panagrellus redivivus TaxID=6233 RepID=A0A7E4VHC7_PANRE
MLFMNRTPVDIEATKYDGYRAPDQNATRTNLRNIAFTVTGFYILVSCIAVIFYPPLSLITLIVPFITLLLAICAARSAREDAFWPCILLAILGLILKLIGCVVFMSVFGFEADVKKTPNFRLLHGKKVNDSHGYDGDMRVIFFYILTGAEAFLFVISCCIRWHLLAFRNCMSS